MSTIDISSLRDHVKQRQRDYRRRADNGDETWIEDAIEEFLDLTVSEAQRTICRAVASEKKTVVVTANGLGKSYIAAAIVNVWLAVLHPGVAFATSGTYSKLQRTFCKPVQSLHDNALGGIGLPGTYKKQPPRIEIEGEPEHYFEASSPKDSGELEGVHSSYTLGVIEECDKPDINAEVVDSMQSLITDDRDRLLAIANPPLDESNIVYEMINDPTWETVQLSSFDSHNVQVEIGEVDGELIDGLATLGKIKDDWRSFNQREWPGVEEARTSYTDDTLDTRWYRRRLGRIPPRSADVHRPFTTTDVTDAFGRDPETVYETPQGLGLDIARMGGDENVLAGVFADDIRIIDRWKGTDHNQNVAKLRGLLQESWDATLAIDATGEGSGPADRIGMFYPSVRRFNNGENAANETVYKNCWTEAIAYLGESLANGGAFTNRRLREELLAAANVVEYEERYYSSRDAEVLKATQKAAIKEYLGRSPDCLDAAAMACWAAHPETDRTQAIDSTWCDARV